MVGILAILLDYHKCLLSQNSLGIQFSKELETSFNDLNDIY